MIGMQTDCGSFATTEHFTGKTMSVDTFDPSQFNAQNKSIDAATLALALELAAAGAKENFVIELTAEQIATLARLMQHSGWQDAGTDLDDAAIVGLIRLFTLGEMRYPEWKAEAKSPVVGLMRVLKKRKTVPADLVSWIKANTSNRFLPHGDLMDLL